MRQSSREFLIFHFTVVTLLISEYKEQVRALSEDSVWQEHFPLQLQLGPGLK